MVNRIFLFVLSIVFLFFFTPSSYADTSLAYQYDANGNLISGDGKYYEYNDANKLVKVRHSSQNGPVIAEYVYDYTGQRIKKIENGVTTYYIGKHYEVNETPAGVSNTSYYFANGERVAKKTPSGALQYYHSDHLGGTNILTNSSGGLIERTKYYPFGEVREGGNDKYLYTGKEKDRLTDWFYYEARYYGPKLKHFTQADTVDPNLYDPQSLNRYAYVRNNPLKYVDPSGHKYIWKTKQDETRYYNTTKILDQSDLGKKMHEQLNDFAEKYNITISFEKIGGKGLSNSCEGGYCIQINSRLGKVDSAITFAHEVQHIIDFVFIDRVNEIINRKGTTFNNDLELTYIWTETNAFRSQDNVRKELELYGHKPSISFKYGYGNWDTGYWFKSPEEVGVKWGTQEYHNNHMQK